MKSEYVAFFIVLSLNCIICQNATEKSDELRYVISFSRNGARSPDILNSHDYDIFGEKWQDDGQMTANGIKHEYIKGAKLKKHYMDRLRYLTRAFNNEDVSIYTSNSNGALMTVYSQLLGMYPSGSGPKLKQEQLKATLPNVDYIYSDQLYETLGRSAIPEEAQLFPIYTFPPENNYFGLTEDKNCKGIIPIKNKNKERKVITDFQDHFHTKYYNKTKLMNNTYAEKISTDRNYFKNYENVKLFCDNLISGFIDNRKLKILKKVGIIKQEIYKDCKEFQKLMLFEVELYDDSNHKIIRTTMSNVFRRLIFYFDGIILKDNRDNSIKPQEVPIDKQYSNEDLDQKMLIYVGHENDLAAFMAYLKIALGTKLYYPKFGSVVNMEFIRSKNAPAFANVQDYYVNLYFNDHDLIQLSYKEFKKNIVSHLVSRAEIDRFCGLTEDLSIYFTIAMILLLIISVSLGVWIYFLIRGSKEEDAEDEPRESEKLNSQEQNLLNNENQ
jgi:hypothetical protein